MLGKGASGCYVGKCWEELGGAEVGEEAAAGSRLERTWACTRVVAAKALEGGLVGDVF